MALPPPVSWNQTLRASALADEVGPMNDGGNRQQWNSVDVLLLGL